MRKRILVLAFAALFIFSSVLFIGCSKQSTAPTDTSSKNLTDAQVLNINLGEEPPNLDPQKATDVVSFDVLNATLEGLVRLNKEGKVEKGSGLAKDWKYHLMD